MRRNAGEVLRLRVANAPCERYEVVADRRTISDVPPGHPDVVCRLSEWSPQWAEWIGVPPWEPMSEIVRNHGG